MLSTILTILVAILHGYFLYLEMFKWEAPRTRKVFGTTAEFAAESRVLAANQGLYNGFLAVGLIYGLWLGPAGEAMVGYLLACIIVAGIYGAATANRRIIFVQSLPAALALGALWLGI